LLVRMPSKTSFVWPGPAHRDVSGVDTRVERLLIFHHVVGAIQAPHRKLQVFKLALHALQSLAEVDIHTVHPRTAWPVLRAYAGRDMAFSPLAASFSEKNESPFTGIGAIDAAKVSNATSPSGGESPARILWASTVSRRRTA
jgi:hypothetical protein